MGGKEKPGFLTPKAIANRIKSKGLQKLRWYCQMCQKQCRDANGFKCHTMSESHQRQLLLFGENAGKFLDEFSRDFNNGYMQILRRQFGTKRVHANIVYQEYIKDKDHVHMNGTKWHSLSGYVQYLGRTGAAHVEQTEKGWFLTYIDRDPETLRRKEEQEKKRKLDLDDRERQQLFLEKQIERAKDKEAVQGCEPTELKKSQDEVIKISFIKKATNLSSNALEPTTSVESKKPISEISADPDDEYDDEEAEEDDEYEDDEEESHLSMIKEEENESSESTEPVKPPEEDKKPIVTIETKPEPVEQKFKMPKVEEKIPTPAPSTSSSISSSSLKLTNVFKTPSTEKRKLNALDEIMQSEEKRREKSNRKDYWLHKNIVVKIMASKLGEKYYKKKGVVVDVVDTYTGVVRLLDPPNSTLKLDQAHLETVLPAISKQVLVVNGAYRGEVATLDEINEKDFSARITIAAGPLKGRVVSGVQYEDISKLHQV